MMNGPRFGDSRGPYLKEKSMNEELKAKSAKEAKEEPPKTYRAFTVTPCLNGFIVAIGCQFAVFETLTALADALKEYEKDPWWIEKMWQRETMVRDAMPGAIVGTDPIRAEYPTPTTDRLR